MIRTLYIVSTLRQCGPINLLYNLIKYLDRSIFKPLLITLSPEPAYSRWQDFKELGVELYTLGISRLKGLFFAISRLTRIVNELNVDIVHTQGIRPDTIAAMYLDGCKTIASLNNNPYYDYSMRYGKIAGHLIALHHLKMLRRIGLVVAVSNSVSTMLKERDNFTVDLVQNGVDTDIFYPAVSDRHKQELRRNLGISSTGKVFISMGHLTSLKDPLTIVKAFRDNRLSGSSHIVFVGDGPERERCERYGRSHNITFFGRVPNVADYLRACDFFISASQTEGLPSATLEAMACGLPCVLSDIEAHREIARYNPASARLFQVRDAQSLANKVGEVLDQDYTIMSQAAVGIIRDYLNAKVMSEKYQRFYLKIYSD